MLAPVRLKSNAIFPARNRLNRPSINKKYLSICLRYYRFTRFYIRYYYLFIQQLSETNMSQPWNHRFQLWGWIIFIFSALFFMAASIRADDPVSLIGGLLFLIACFVFLVPLVAEITAGSSSLSRLRKYSRYPRDWFRAASSLSRAPGAPRMLPALERPLDQIQRHRVRSELRFFASMR